MDASHEDARIDWPVYRVNFWSRPYEGYGYMLDGWLLWQCDVNEIVEWIQENAGGREYELLVTPHNNPESVQSSDPLIRLAGWDPNSTVSPEWREQMRTSTDTTSEPSSAPHTIGWHLDGDDTKPGPS